MRCINLVAILLFPLLVCAQKPNIIFIMSDDMGNGEVGYNNSDWDTPAIDSLAANGVIFSAAYAQPQCTPSRAAFLTGRYPFRDGMQVGVTNLWSEKHLPTERLTIPEMLASEGYMCGMVGKWHLGNSLPEYLPHSHGFNYWYGSTDGVLQYTEHTARTVSGGPYDVYENGVTQTDASTYYTELLGQKAVDYINAVAGCGTGNPFFLWVSFTAPHNPYQAPADTIALAPGGWSTDKKTKWAMVRIMDNEIGKIVQAVEDNGIADNTIIIFYSDNGSPTTTYYHSTGVGDNAPYRGGKFTLWEGGCRVPAVWYQPGSVTPGTTSTPVHLVDILPTLASITGAGIAISDTVDGVDISPLLDGDTIAERGIILSIIEDRHWGVVQGDWKLVNNPNYSCNYDSTLTEDIRLYDLGTDPGETTDVDGANPAIVTELQAIIDAYLPSVATPQQKTDSPPPGWVEFPVIASPKTYYDPDYYFFRAY